LLDRSIVVDLRNGAAPQFVFLHEALLHAEQRLVDENNRLEQEWQRKLPPVARIRKMMPDNAKTQRGESNRVPLLAAIAIEPMKSTTKHDPARRNRH